MQMRSELFRESTSRTGPAHPDPERFLSGSGCHNFSGSPVGENLPLPSAVCGSHSFLNSRRYDWALTSKNQRRLP
jgi:hypothetical protein